MLCRASQIACAVRGNDPQNKKARVGLTTRLEMVNSGLGPGDLTAGRVLAAAVVSTEDHGYVVDFGIPEVTGFLKKAEAANFIKEVRRGFETADCVL